MEEQSVVLATWPPPHSVRFPIPAAQGSLQGPCPSQLALRSETHPDAVGTRQPLPPSWTAREGARALARVLLQGPGSAGAHLSWRPCQGLSCPDPGPQATESSWTCPLTALGATGR